MKRKLAQRMLKARSQKLDRARAQLAALDREIRAAHAALARAHQQRQALSAGPTVRSSELERAHLECQQLERDLQHKQALRQRQHAALLTSYHHKEQGQRVLDKLTALHKENQRTQEQRCNDDRSPEHLKKLAS